ncbi:hypothetical protein ABVT39_000889 [Epinephelus coioides]
MKKLKNITLCYKDTSPWSNKGRRNVDFTARGLPCDSDEPEEKQDENEEKDEKEAGLDETAREVLQNLPAEYIMKKLVKSQDGWTPKGEFIHEGKIVRGSHMIDLFKNLSVSYKKKSLTPKGWTGFFNTLMELNIPISSVTNPCARAPYHRLKTVGGWHEGEEAEEEEEGEEGAVAPVKREKGKQKKQDLNPFAEEEEWVTPVKRSERKSGKRPLAGLIIRCDNYFNKRVVQLQH